AVAATPNQHIAAIIAAAFYALWNLFSGFIIPRTRIPVWWRWYYWACPVAWTLYGLVTSQYGDIEDRLLDTNVTVKQYLDDYFGFEHDFLGVVAAVIVGFTVLSYLSLPFPLRHLTSKGDKSSSSSKMKKWFCSMYRLLDSIDSPAMRR
ncbi:Pleiotropic drug resistance protein 1, partial [Vitis vinifera]